MKALIIDTTWERAVLALIDGDKTYPYVGESGARRHSPTVLAEAEKSTVNPDAANDLNEKLAIVESYFKNTWGMYFFDDETTGTLGLETHFRKAIADVVANPPLK